MAALRSGPPVVFLDNLTDLDNAPLASALTNRIYAGRVLGTSTNFAVPVRCAWLGTGNNVTMSGELTRRVAPIQLNAKVENPEWRRGFAHEDLEGYALANRGELIWAALTIIQNWVAKGCQPGKAYMGSYESWAKVMSGIMESAGVPGFLGNVEELKRNTDIKGRGWRIFTEIWWKKHGALPVKASELRDLADLHELLMNDLYSPNERGRTMKMGNCLQSRKDTIFGGLTIRVGENRNGSMYFLERELPETDQERVARANEYANAFEEIISRLKPMTGADMSGKKKDAEFAA